MISFLREQKVTLIISLIALAFIIEFAFYMNNDEQRSQVDKHVPQSESPKLASIANQNNVNSTKKDGVLIPNQTNTSAKSTKQSEQNSSGEVKENIIVEESSPVRASYSSAASKVVYSGIEDIKEKIYNMRIEYTDQLDELEAIVETGDLDQKKFWNGTWNSVDDWKRREDSFNIKINSNGKFTFATADGIHQSSTAYAFNREKREFTWEEDYYGKIISHRAKFINPDTLLIIKTSGYKVNLDIYEKERQ